MFSYEFWEISKNTFLYRTPPAARFLIVGAESRVIVPLNIEWD